MHHIRLIGSIVINVCLFPFIQYKSMSIICLQNLLNTLYP